MAESEEELKSFLMKVKESEKVGLEIMTSSPITSWQIDGETVTDFIFGGSIVTSDFVTAAMKLTDAHSLEGNLVMTKLDSILKRSDNVRLHTNTNT